MPNYNYVAWFRNHTLEPDDQDYEWPACFTITAGDEHSAKVWGDKLAASYSHRNEECQFFRSYLNTDGGGVGTVPQIKFGEDASDEVIGW